VWQRESFKQVRRLAAHKIFMSLRPEEELAMMINKNQTDLYEKKKRSKQLSDWHMQLSFLFTR
jgi:hypothetical protein